MLHPECDDVARALMMLPAGAGNIKPVRADVIGISN